VVKISILDRTESNKLMLMAGSRLGFGMKSIGSRQLPTLSSTYMFPPMYPPLQNQYALPQPFQFKSPIPMPPVLPQIPYLPNPFAARASVEEEIKTLENQVTALKSQLEDARRRIAELEG
jgi:hypothetical protein